MPRYEIKFYVETKTELSEGEIANFAHTVYDRMNQRGEMPKPIDRKVYVARRYESHEERAIVKKHAAANFQAGRVWDCSCNLCAEYRKLGVVISREEAAS